MKGGVRPFKGCLLHPKPRKPPRAVQLHVGGRTWCDSTAVRVGAAPSDGAAVFALKVCRGRPCCHTHSVKQTSPLLSVFCFRIKTPGA